MSGVSLLLLLKRLGILLVYYSFLLTHTGKCPAAGVSRPLVCCVPQFSARPWVGWGIWADMSLILCPTWGGAIWADSLLDLGWGDFGCYVTPHSQGRLFRNFHILPTRTHGLKRARGKSTNLHLRGLLAFVSLVLAVVL